VTGPRLLRLKGIVHLEEDSERPLVIHARPARGIFNTGCPDGPRPIAAAASSPSPTTSTPRWSSRCSRVITGTSFGAKARPALTIAGLAGIGIGVTVALSIALRSAATAQLGPVPDSPFKYHTHLPTESSQ